MTNKCLWKACRNEQSAQKKYRAELIDIFHELK